MQVIVVIATLILFLGFYSFFGFIWWRIFRKTGYHGALGLLMIVPIANLIMLIILAFREWPIRAELSKLPEGKVKTYRSLPVPLIVAITIVAMLPGCALVVAIAIPNFLRARLLANDASATNTVRSIYMAAEAYASANKGTYPSDEFNLVYANPPYINTAFNNRTIQGYSYSLKLNPNGYEISAIPEKCSVTGTKIFKASTGGMLIEKECE